jgi:hypothetical protein
MAQNTSKSQSRQKSAPSQSAMGSGEMVNALEGATGDIVRHFKEYASENPGAAAVWCLGVGFVLGWRLKPW